MDAPFGLLSGWLGVASSLGVVIANPKWNQKFVLPVVAAMVAAIAAILAKPFVCIPVLVVSVANVHGDMMPAAFAAQISSLLGILISLARPGVF